MRRVESARVVREVVRQVARDHDRPGCAWGRWVGRREAEIRQREYSRPRVHVNDELGGLERALSATERLLEPGGRLVAITFQSGEDRVVKRFISEREGRCVCPRLACSRAARSLCSAGALSGGLIRERWRRTRAAPPPGCGRRSGRPNR